jgi:hypothetical protein
MKPLWILAIALVVVTIFYYKKTEDFTLPEPVLNLCPPGYVMSCVLKTLPGFQTPPPLPEKYRGACEETHVAACLPSPENIMKPKSNL